MHNCISLWLNISCLWNTLLKQKSLEKSWLHTCMIYNNTNNLGTVLSSSMEQLLFTDRHIACQRRGGHLVSAARTLSGQTITTSEKISNIWTWTSACRKSREGGLDGDAPADRDLGAPVGRGTIRTWNYYTMILCSERILILCTRRDRSRL